MKDRCNLQPHHNTTFPLWWCRRDRTGNGSRFPSRVAYFRPESTNLGYFKSLGCTILASGYFRKLAVLAYFLGILAVNTFSLCAKPELAYFQSEKEDITCAFPIKWCFGGWTLDTALVCVSAVGCYSFGCFDTRQGLCRFIWMLNRWAVELLMESQRKSCSCMSATNVKRDIFQ